MKLRQITRKIRLLLTGRIDCAPRFDARAPQPEWDASLPKHRNARDGMPVVVEYVNRHTQRVHWGPSPAHHYLRYTAEWHEDEARRLANAWAPIDAAAAPGERRRFRGRA